MTIKLTAPGSGHQIRVTEENADFWRSRGYRDEPSSPEATEPSPDPEPEAGSGVEPPDPEPKPAPAKKKAKAKQPPQPKHQDG